MNEFEPKQFGKYYLLEKLAVGGMAEIYKAKTFGVDGFEKELAIKRILPHCSADKDFITMLIDEAKLSVMLSHANIVQVYDLGKVGDDYFISMEFIHGLNLRDIMYHCREEKISIPPDIAIFIASEMCKGLDYAHRKTDQQNKPLNIVHRDVSPQNVLISYEGEVKIVDFGIAKAAMNISHTMAGILKGKIAYMSPEQAMGKAIDRRTDIFSTGILLYEMITGTKLYTGESQFEVLKKIRTMRISAAGLPDSVPALLKPIIAKALAYNVDERYANAGDLQIDLTKYLYTTHSDFSPRKLSRFIREIFAGDLEKEKAGLKHEMVAERQTASMSVGEGARQMEIVHREVSYPPRPIAPAGETKISGDTFKVHKLNRFGETAAKQKGRSPARPDAQTESRTFRKKNYWLPALFTALALIAASSFAVFEFVPSLRFWQKAPEPPPLPPPAETTIPVVPLTPPEPAGMLNVITDPPGAAIMIEGKLTGFNTPMSIENLPLNSDLRITLSKPEYEDYEQVIKLTSTKPQRISTKLKPVTPQSGRIEITSNPPGAAVMINDADTGRITPATIANLEPSKYSVTLTMNGFEKWSESFDVKVGESVRVDATLAKIPEKPPVPQPSPPTTTEGAPPPQPPPAEFGSLRVESSPSGAKVFIDGRATNQKTPATFDSLKIGTAYNIRLDIEGYKSTFARKTIKKESETLFARLSKEEEKPPEPPQPVLPPPAKEEPRAMKEPSVEKIETKGGEGKIKVSSVPSGADVFINGEHRGKTPLTASVPAGPARILVSKEGMGKQSRTVTVKPGETVNVTDIELGGEFGSVSFTSDPPHAQVIFDGQALSAPTPVTVRKVTIGSEHTATVKLPGYRQWSRTFQMDKNSKSFNVTLQPE